MTKTDEVLHELSRTANDFIQSIGSFQYKGKTYNLINNFAASKPMECGVCGNYPIFDISIIRNETGNRLSVCNNCIDRIANQNISDWFKTYRKKRENILDNRKYIDGLSTILASHKQNTLPSQASREDVEKLRDAFVQMCNGLNPGTEQKRHADSYIR